MQETGGNVEGKSGPGQNNLNKATLFGIPILYLGLGAAAIAMIYNKKKRGRS
jgi:phosphotransferase system  glucose/maltose/N-acetylglucosamine-specific IIC component